MKQKGSVGRLNNEEIDEEVVRCEYSDIDVDEFEKCPYYNFTGECTLTCKLCMFDPFR